MHDWQFTVIEYEECIARRIVDCETLDLVNDLEKHGYKTLATTLRAEKAVFDYLNLKARQILRGELPAEQYAKDVKPFLHELDDKTPHITKP